MTVIRIYNDTWYGAFHARRAAIAMPTRPLRGWLDGPIAPRRREATGESAPTAPASGARGRKPDG